MKWTELFERVVVLNLPNRRLRRVRLEEHLTSLEADEGITWVRSHYGKLLCPPGWWNAGQGAWGCLLSHASVIADAIRDKVESLLVLEDDVVFQPDLKRLLTGFLNQVPDDWGQIYLGGQHLKEPDAVKGKPFVMRGRNVNRTHAYAVHKRAMAQIHGYILDAVGYMAHPQGWHVDHRLGTAHEAAEWPVYTPVLWIAGQEEEWSNISGNHNPRFWWHPSAWKRQLPFVLIDGAFTKEALGERGWIHGGNNLKQDTFEDVGLDVAASSPELTLHWLEMIAQEALDQEKLPALQHPKISNSMIDAVWPAGSIRWKPGSAKAVHRRVYESISSQALELAESGCHSAILNEPALATGMG